MSGKATNQELSEKRLNWLSFEHSFWLSLSLTGTKFGPTKASPERGGGFLLESASGDACCS